MGWFFQLVPFIVIVVVITSVARRAAKMLRDQGDRPPWQRPLSGDDPTDPLRTRRIQEEIRRKIAERRAGSTSTPTPPQLESAPARDSGGAQRLAREQRAAASSAAVLERQRQLADQMRALEEARAARAESVLTSASNPPANASSIPSSAPDALRAAVLEDLKAPESARRAVLLREVLGPPVALR